MEHLMIDIETLDTANTSAILSIGCVVFDLDSGEYGESFQVNVGIDSNVEHKRTISNRSLTFWFDQPREVLQKSLVDPVPLDSALFKLGVYIKMNHIKYIWSNGICFDIAILQDVYQKFDTDLPWGFRDVRDVRTFTHFLTIEERDEVKAQFDNLHEPIQDCKMAISLLNKAMNKFISWHG